MRIYTIAKKCFAVLLFTGAAVAANAQNYTFIEGKSATVAAQNHTDEVAVHVKIRNNTKENIELTWTLLENSFSKDNWDLISFCDPYICHNDIPNTFNPPLYANEKGDSLSEFKLAATPKTTAGISTIRIVMWEIGKSNRDTLSFTINAKTLGVADNNIKTNAVTAYPNPAKNTLNLNFGKNAEYNVNVYNMNGARVLSGTVNKANNILDIQSLPQGLYMVNATDEKGNVTVSKFSKI